MNEQEFYRLAEEGYNRAPLISQSLADLETPLSLYLKLAGSVEQGKNTFLLESVIGGERFGRYSFIGLPTSRFLRVCGRHTQVLHEGKVIETDEGDPLAFIESYQRRLRVAVSSNLPRFCGGLVGFFGYDAVRYVESRLAHPSPDGKSLCPLPDDLHLPDILLLQTEELGVIDNLTNRVSLIVYANPQEAGSWMLAQRRLSELCGRLQKALDLDLLESGEMASHRVLRGAKKSSASQGMQNDPKTMYSSQVVSDVSKEDYLRMVRRAREYILAGDCMQVVLGRRMVRPYQHSPLSLYRALRLLNPSPYMYFYNFGDFQVVGASPEILVRQESEGTLEGLRRKVTIRPLAGTRPRGDTLQKDQALAMELQADPKERAEHVMLIDLARNDIGRMAVTGTVRVTEQMAIEKYSHVQHLVSNVEGELRDGLGNADVFRASFPAGTLSGAPKVRAMEIIDELEVSKRGIYGGAVGYLSFNGEMDLAIAIRTGVIREGKLYVQAGAGIVADSEPEAEWQETEVKARSVLRAAEQVEEGILVGGS